MNNTFLDGVDAPKGRWRDPATEKKGVRAAYRWTGLGRDGLEVVYGTAETKPSTAVVREVWKGRHKRRAAPLLVVVAYPECRPRGAVVCGPTGDNPSVVELDPGRAERLARAALGEPHRHLAIRFLAEALESDSDEHPGLRNKGLLATHELLRGVPKRADWEDATARSEPLLRERGQYLVEQLGYEIHEKTRYSVLRSAEGRAQAVAVFLQDTEQADQPASRFENQTPVTYALSHADRDNLPWVVAVRGGSIRLYSTSTSGAAGQRGRAETFVELNLPLLPSEQAGYLQLLFSSSALAEGGTFSQIQRASSDYASELSARLRERVYKEVVPRLAVAVADQVGGTGEDDLERHYRTALTVLFRLMFVAYAEDSRLLPLHVNGEYTDHALKTIARRLSHEINTGQDLGFDNPLTEDVEDGTDTQTDLWDSCTALFHAVDRGHVRWGVPAYNGGLFSTDKNVNPVGEIIEDLSLNNAEFGPALTALIVDRSPDGDIGPIDFRSLSVREFGTIYEGLLESDLSVAEQPLTLNKDDVYVPAGDRDEVRVEVGEVYLHNQSGVRKSTGSYFTKPFAVDHLIAHSVDRTLYDHLDRVRELLDAGKHADAAELLFDFRVADIAMGSGHFLTAVVDRLEALYTTFLADNPIPEVSKELDLLRKSASEALGQLADTVEIENSSLLRRLIARRCVYGVDMNPLAVELARVGMWIHTFVPGLPLSFLDHNLAVGNALTGIGTIEEAVDALTNSGKYESLSLFDDPLREALREAEEPLRRLARITDATAADIRQAREAAAEAEEAVAPVAGLFDRIVAAQIGEVALPMILSVDQLFELGADHTLEAGHARAIAEEMQAFHFPSAFPEVFLRVESGFDVIVGNPPWDKVRHEPQQFWVTRSPGLNAVPQSRRTAEIERLRQERRIEAADEEREQRNREMLKTVFKATYRYQGRYGHLEYAQLFVERAYEITRSENSAIAYVLPRQFLVLSGWSELREILAQRGGLHVAQGRNSREWIFADIHQSYMVAFVVALAGDKNIRVMPAAKSPEDLISTQAFEFEQDDLRSLTNGIAIPWFEDQEEVRLFRQIWQQPSLEEDSKWIRGRHDARWDFRGSGPHRHLASNNIDSGWRVLKTRHVDAYSLDTSETFTQAVDDVHRLGATGTPPQLDWNFPRVVFRHPSRNDDTRTMIATLLPQSGFIYNKGYVHAVDIVEQTPKVALALLGYLNTFVADWWLRRLVDRHVTSAVINNLRMPEWSEEEVSRAAMLAGEILDPRFRTEPTKTNSSSEELSILKGELNALALSGFGLNADDATIMLRDFSGNGVPQAETESTFSALTARADS